MADKKDTKVYQQVIDYISEEVDKGKLGKGDKIPTERKLVEILGIGRNSIREALKILDMIGLVEKVPGQGNFVKEEFNNWMIEPMATIFKLSGTSQKEVFEFRKMIEVQTATLAAERITDAEIEELKQCYDEMIRAVEEIDKAQLDKKFHYIIAKATKNDLILNGYNAMSPMLNLFTIEIRSTVRKNEIEGMIEEMHKNIFQAIINRDKNEAREYMKTHMQMINKYYYYN